jgi:hypothetical protein
MNPQSENARRFRIAADAGETSIEIELPQILPNGKQPGNYRIVKKDIPDAAKGKTYGQINGQPAVVKWINCFGIRLRGTFGGKNNPFIEEVSGEQFEYEVIVPTSSKPEGYTNLVYFDGENVQPARNVTEDSEGYHFKLNIGDPPTGWGDG